MSQLLKKHSDELWIKMRIDDLPAEDMTKLREICAHARPPRRLWWKRTYGIDGVLCWSVLLKRVDP